MAKPTGVPSRARRIPVDVDTAVQTEADLRGSSWVGELRRRYLDQSPEPLRRQAPELEALEIADGGAGSGQPSEQDRAGVTTDGQGAEIGQPTIARRTGRLSAQTVRSDSPATSVPSGRCQCGSKAVMSKIVSNVCTRCHLIR